MIQVSVIIPVYGIERFAERCAQSLFGQSLEDVEFIFVDDASPDRSISIIEDTLKDYPLREKQVSIIRHPVNKGLPAARNSGLEKAQGDYIYHCDSDDWMEPEILKKMYETAQSSGADIVYCDFFLSFEKNERYMSNPTYKTGKTMLSEGFLCGLMKYNVWNKLVKRTLYTDNDIRFPEGHPMGEDMTIIQLTALANKVEHLPKALYHYVKQNEGAYSNTITEKKLADIQFNVNRTVAFLQNYYGHQLDREISLFKLNIKLPFLLTGDRKMYQLWTEWYPEANAMINENKCLPRRTRLLQIMAAKSQWWYIDFYFKYIFKFVYGTLFK